MSTQDTGSTAQPPSGPESSSGLGLVFNDIRGLILRPGQAIPKIMVTPGFGFFKVVAGIYIVSSIILFFLSLRLGLGYWPWNKFTTFIWQLFGEIFFVSVTFAAVHVSLTAVIKRRDIRLEHSANVVAIALVPAIAVKVVFLILSPISFGLVAHLRLLEAIAPATFMMAALFLGLRLNARGCLYTALAAVTLGFLSYNVVSGGGLAEKAALSRVQQQSAEWMKEMGMPEYGYR